MSGIIKLQEVVSAAFLDEARTRLASSGFRDGKASAGRWAQSAKKNEEASPAPAISELGRKLYRQLNASPLFRSAALPRQVSEFIFSRYGKGMTYGLHLDDPVMGQLGSGDQQLRTDLALTVFLSDPASYDGGELRIHAIDGIQAVKLDAGSAVLYPASSLHEVTPVVRGERLAAVGWIQSLIRDAEQRALLLDLDLARTELRQAAPDALATARVDNAYANLIRRWAEV